MTYYMLYTCTCLCVYFFFFTLKISGVTGEVQTMSEGIRELTLTLRHIRIICSTREVRTRGGGGGRGRCGIKKVIMLILLSVDER